MPSLVVTGTEWVRVPFTLDWGELADITSVGIYLTDDPAEVPAPVDFETATLVDTEDALGDGERLFVAALVGTKGSAISIPADVDDVQVWLLAVTDDEDIIRRADTIEVIR